MDTMSGSEERFGGSCRGIEVDCIVGQQSDYLPCPTAAQNVQIGETNTIHLHTSPRSAGPHLSPVASSASTHNDSATTRGGGDTAAASVEVHQHGGNNSVIVVLPDQRYSLSDVKLIRRLELVQQPGGAATCTKATVKIRIELKCAPPASTQTSSTSGDEESTHTDTVLEKAAMSVMRMSKRLKNFFEGLRISITNIFRGCIVLELQAESPDSLKNLLKNLEKLDSVLVEELKDESVLKNVQGNVLQMKISIIIPDGIVEASGITDLKQFMTELNTQAADNLEWGTAFFPDKERRIVLLGITGSGKSATGNSILGRKAFESRFCGTSITKKCQRGTAVRHGRDVQIIDCPGFFDTEMTSKEITREVIKCVGMTSPGPHAFVLVVRPDRFTEQEQETVVHFRNIFGDRMLNYLIILFTRKDDLQQDYMTLEMYLRNVPQTLNDLVKSCNNRYIAVNNRAPESKLARDVEDFLQLVDRVLMDNGGTCYTNEMYEEAEKRLKKREEAVKREQEQEIEKKKKELKSQFQQELQHKYDVFRQQKRQLPQDNDREKKLFRREKGYQDERQEELLGQEKVRQEEEVRQRQERQREQFRQEQKEQERLEEQFRQEKERQNELLLQEIQNLEREAEDNIKKFRNDVRQDINNESGSFFEWLMSSLISFFVGSMR